MLHQIENLSIFFVQDFLANQLSERYAWSLIEMVKAYERRMCSQEKTDLRFISNHFLSSWEMVSLLWEDNIVLRWKEKINLTFCSDRF